MWLDEMAWSFAVLVARVGVCIDDFADKELGRLVPNGSDRRAVIALALLKGLVELEEYGGRVYGRDFYKTGPTFHRTKRDRHERLHGIGSAPREDWEPWERKTSRSTG